MAPELVRGDGVFPPAAYERDDESPDDRFYSVPRKVVHIDDGAIAALQRLYADVLPARGRLLDLMSSWRSHLPAEHAASVVGLGLNAEEMADNPQLASHVVHDLNQDPRLPFDDASFDGAMCAVSIQYVLHPARSGRPRPSWCRSRTAASPRRPWRCGSGRRTSSTPRSCERTSKPPAAGRASAPKTDRRAAAIRCMRSGRSQIRCRRYADASATSPRGELFARTSAPSAARH